MSLGVITERQYKRIAKNAGVLRLKELDVTNVDFTYVTPDTTTANKAVSWNSDGTGYHYTFPSGDSTPLTSEEVWTIPEDGLYFIYMGVWLLPPGDNRRVGYVVSNALKLFINDERLDSFGCFYSQELTNQFMVRLKKGTKVKCTYSHDNGGAMTGVYLQIDSFIQKFNK
jgi:hypothetical protein